MIQWSLLRLNPQKQNGYIELLNEYYPDIESYAPMFSRLCRPHGVRQPVVVWRPVFPGYLFVRTEDLHGPVSLPVRASWVKFGGEIEKIPERVIDGLKWFEERNELVREVKYVNPYVAGARVIVHLEVSDIGAVIVRLVNGNRAIVDSALCRVTVPIHQVEVV